MTGDGDLVELTNKTIYRYSIICEPMFGKLIQFSSYVSAVLAGNKMLLTSSGFEFSTLGATAQIILYLCVVN